MLAHKRKLEQRLHQGRGKAAAVQAKLARITAVLQIGGCAWGWRWGSWPSGCLNNRVHPPPPKHWHGPPRLLTAISGLRDILSENAMPCQMKRNEVKRICSLQGPAHRQTCRQACPPLPRCVDSFIDFAFRFDFCSGSPLVEI